MISPEIWPSAIPKLMLVMLWSWRFSPTAGLSTGVQIKTQDGPHEIKAKKEVILCAGSLNSPQLLELSGNYRDAVGLEKICTADTRELEQLWGV
jgi:hypothetical protein